MVEATAKKPRKAGWTPESKKALRAKLVEALRSGKYKQTKWRLARPFPHDEIGLCCLGVACVVAGFKPTKTKTTPGKPDLEKYGLDPFGYNIKGCNGALPMVVKDMFGFSTSYGHYLEGDVRYSLQHLNDEREWTFEQIADIIEKAPPEMFDD